MHFRTTVCRMLGLAFAGLVVSVSLTACSGADSDDESLNSDSNDSQSNLGEDDAKEGNGQENYVDNDESKGSKDSADVNSAVGDAAAAAPEGGSDPLLGNAGADGTPGALGGNAAPANAAAANVPPANAAPANAAPANGGAAPTAATTAAAAAAPAAPAPAAAAGTAPIPGGRVRYVKEGGAQVVNAPNGSPVTTLEQGDHPLTWEENGFLKLSSGMYVPVDSLSQTGVARAAGNSEWSH